MLHVNFVQILSWFPTAARPCVESHVSQGTREPWNQHKGMTVALSVAFSAWMLFVGDSTQRELTSAVLLVLNRWLGLEPQCLQHPPNTAHEDWNIRMQSQSPSHAEPVFVSFRYLRGIDEDKIRTMFGGRGNFSTLNNYLDTSLPLRGGPWRCTCTERRFEAVRNEVPGIDILPAPDVVIANMGEWMLPSIAASRSHYEQPFSSSQVAQEHYARNLPKIFASMATNPSLAAARSQIIWRDTFCVPPSHLSASATAHVDDWAACRAYNSLLASLVSSYRDPSGLRLLQTAGTMERHNYTMRDASKGHVSERINLDIAVQLLLMMGVEPPDGTTPSSRKRGALRTAVNMQPGSQLEKKPAPEDVGWSVAQDWQWGRRAQASPFPWDILDGRLWEVRIAYAPKALFERRPADRPALLTCPRPSTATGTSADSVRVCVCCLQAHVVNSSTRWINNTKHNVRTCGAMTTVNVGHGWFPLA